MAHGPLTGSEHTIAVTNRYRWRLRGAHCAEDARPDSFFVSRQKSLLGEIDLFTQNSLLKHLPDPFTLKDLSKAVKRILLALERGEPITIFGDYDVDGTTSCAMLRRFFNDIGHPVDVYIPERLVEGYGLNPIGLEKIKAKGGSLIITVDNGIAAVDACQKAKSLGLEVIITDHHDLPPTLPEAFAILNPKQTDCQFPFRMLAGVGVAFYLMAGLRAALRETQSTRFATVNLRQYLDYVALGTIADMAPLDGVNHILCKVGLEVMYENVLSGARPGIAALLQAAGWDSASCIEASDVGFKLGPRLNAAGRLGNALASEEVLETDNPIRARELAQALSQENAERQQLEKAMTAEAFAQIAKMKTIPMALVLHSEDWHPGVVGLVASRVLEKFYRPTVILGTLDGKLKGSGRSIHSFDLFGALNCVRDEFASFGGHFHAVGLSLEPSKLAWLQDHLHSKAVECLQQSDLMPQLDVDGFVDLSSLDRPFLEQLAVFEPYGIENPRPKWVLKRAEIRNVKRIGKSPNSNHARVTLRDHSAETSLTAFDMAEQLESALKNGKFIDLVVEGRMGFWNGNRKPELRVVDFSPISV